MLRAGEARPGGSGGPSTRRPQSSSRAQPMLEERGQDDLRAYRKITFTFSYTMGLSQKEILPFCL